MDYLATYPVDRLKIAQELVFGVTADVRHALVVKAAIRLAHELGTEVIAEGVESEAQARFLIDAECKYAQGYFFSRPLTADATTALLRQGRMGHCTAGDLESEGLLDRERPVSMPAECHSETRLAPTSLASSLVTPAFKRKPDL